MPGQYLQHSCRLPLLSLPLLGHKNLDLCCQANIPPLLPSPVPPSPSAVPIQPSAVPIHPSPRLEPVPHQEYWPALSSECWDPPLGYFNATAANIFEYCHCHCQQRAAITIRSTNILPLLPLVSSSAPVPLAPSSVPVLQHHHCRCLYLQRHLLYLKHHHHWCCHHRCHALRQCRFSSFFIFLTCTWDLYDIHGTWYTQASHESRRNLLPCYKGVRKSGTKRGP